MKPEDNSFNTVEPSVEPIAEPNVEPIAEPTIQQAEQVQPVVNEQMYSNPMDNNPMTEGVIGFEEPKKNFIKPLIIAVAVIVVLIIGFLVFSSLKKVKVDKATQTFENSINKQITKFSEMIKGVKALDVLDTTLNNKGTVIAYLDFKGNGMGLENLSKFKYKFNFKGNGMGLENLSKFKYKFNLGYDKNTKKLNVGTEISDVIGNKLDATLQIINNKGYLDLGKIYDNPILVEKLDKEKIDSIFDKTKKVEETSVSNDDLLIVIKTIGEGLKKGINEKDVITTNNVTRNIRGTDINLTKLSYTLTKERNDNIIMSIVTELENNPDALKIVKEIDEDFIKKLKEPIDESTWEDIEINLYVKTDGELVVLELLNAKDKKELITYTTSDNVYTFRFVGDDSKTFELEYSDETSKKISLTFNDAGEITEIKLRMVDKSSTGSFGKDNNLVIKSGDIDLEINLNIVVTEKYDFKDLDVTNAVKIGEMDEAEITKLMENIERNTIIKSFSELVGDTMGGIKDDVINRTKCSNATGCTGCDETLNTCRCTYTNDKGISERIICPIDNY